MFFFVFLESCKNISTDVHVIIEVSIYSWISTCSWIPEHSLALDCTINKNLQILNIFRQNLS